MSRPQSVAIAVFAIWATIALDLIVTAIESQSDVGSSNQLLVSIIASVLYGLLTHNIATGKNWARHVYAFLAAVEVSALLAFGMDDATQLESAVSIVSIPVEVWILFMLFRAESAQWFETRKVPRSQ